jgi:sRNA-binding regulator protein Hfq
MQSVLGRGGGGFDASQPGVRHIQGLIRQGSPLQLTLLSGEQLQGVLRWQDQDYLAISQEGQPLTLVNRHAVALLRALA